MPTLQDRYRGSLLGLAAVDAVGTTLEFQSRSFEPLRDMVGGGPFGLEPGQWTDDSSMALCLAASLVQCRGFDARDQMNRYCDWFSNGYMSSNGRCFDVGRTVESALRRFRQTDEPLSGSTDPQSAGNGSLMRLVPVVLFYHPDRTAVLHYAGESSRTAHGAREAVDACRIFAAILAAALWCFERTDSFEDAVLAAANLGDDADITAAVAGQIAGAYYGATGIPEGWSTRVALREEIIGLADALRAGAA